MVVGVLVLSACGDSGPASRIDDIDVFLARVCEAAAQCPGVAASQAEIQACPAELLSDLSATQIETVEGYLELEASAQTCILDCTGGRICGRFGAGLSSISDSDLLETLSACEQECGGAGSLGVAVRWDEDAACRGVEQPPDPRAARHR